MSPLKRRIFGAFIVLLAVVAVIFGSIYLLVESPKFHQWIEEKLSRETGYQVRIGELRLGLPFSLTAAAVSVTGPSGLLFQGERLILTVRPLDLFSRSIHRLELEKPSFQLDLHDFLDSSSKNQLNLAIRHLNIKEGTLVLKTAGGSNLDFRSITVNAENLNLGETTGVRLHADLPWLNGQGAFLIEGGANEKKLEVRVRQGRPRLTGPTEDALTMRAVLRGEQNGNLEVLASGKAVDFAIADDKISGDFDSRLDLEPTFNNVGFSSNIRLSNLPSKPGPIPFFLLGGAATARVTGNFLVPDKLLALKQAHLESLSGTADGGATVRFGSEPNITGANLKLQKVPMAKLKTILPAPLNDYSYDGLVDADLNMEGPWRAPAIKGLARSPGVKVSSPIVSLAQVSFKLPFEWAGSSFRAYDVQAQAKTLALNDRDRAHATVEGLTLDGGLESKPNEPLKIIGRLQITGGRFATPDNSKVGENLALGGNFTFVKARLNQPTTVTARIAVEKGEVLWGKFFSDLRIQKPALEFSGGYVADRGEIRLGQGKLSLASIGNIAVSGTIERIGQTPVFRLDLASEDFQPAGFYEFFIRETFNRSYPLLDKLTVGGSLRFSAQATGPLDNISAAGSVHLKGGEIRTKSNDWQIGPLEIALPFRVGVNGAARDASISSSRNGTLTIASARFGAESIPTLKTTLSLWNNELRFPQPIRVSTLGGTVEVSNLLWNDVVNHPNELSFSLETKNVQLQRLTDVLGWYRFGGTLTGSIPRVESVENSLRSQGEIQLAVFGGQVRIAKLEIENPFSSLPSIKLDANLDNIRLEQASETFAFGQISGILEGTVNDLVITNGQPSQFTADLHTVEKRGVSQWISVEALNKITVLSSGSDAGSLYGGIAGLFENFRYSKLGFRAILKNDRLTLRGIDSKDGKEFLVVGSWLPPTVNVISHTQEIGFSELLRRLQRIQSSEQPATPAK
jgi:hypothetical protein